MSLMLRGFAMRLELTQQGVREIHACKLFERTDLGSSTLQRGCLVSGEAVHSTKLWYARTAGLELPTVVEFPTMPACLFVSQLLFLESLA